MHALPEWTRGVHHDGSDLYVSNLFPKIGETVTVTLRTPLNAPIRHVFLRARPDGEFQYQKLEIFRRDAVSAWWRCDFPIENPRNHYCFKLMADDGAYFYNAYSISRADFPDWFNFVILADYQAPEWVRETVFYQIFPERFHNGDPSNDVQDGQWSHKGFKTRKMKWGESPISWKKNGSLDFFGGDLQGIVQKLDYLSDLGINALYLTPIFDANSNHFYDITDFNRVATHLGGDAGLAQLREATRQQQMRLILDITTNHIGSLHPWFTAAEKNHSGPTAEYFHYHEDSKSFEYWLGVSTLIKLNYESQALREEMYRKPDSAIRRWLKAPYAIDGWRLDVANMTANFASHQLDHEVWKEMRAVVKQDNPDAYFFGEYFQDGTPHAQGDELDAVMNYQGFNIPVRRWLGGTDLGVEWFQEYGDKSLMPTDAMAQQWQIYLAAVPFVIAQQQFNQLGSHDTGRILHIVKGDKALAKLGASLLLTFVGVPCIYYGDEIALNGGPDPDNRRCMPWDEADWDAEMRNHYKRLIEIRRGSHALKHGGFQLLYAENDLIVFQRQSSREQVIVAAYRGAENLKETWVDAWTVGLADGAQLRDLLSGKVFVVKEGKFKLEGLVRGQAVLLKVGHDGK